MNKRTLFIASSIDSGSQIFRLTPFAIGLQMTKHKYHFRQSRQAGGLQNTDLFYREINKVAIPIDQN